MLDVHPPEHAAHTWRDFFIHIATIVLGLLIAIGLEQSVEWLHERHVRHELLEGVEADAGKAIGDCNRIHISLMARDKWAASRIAQVQEAIHSGKPLAAAESQAFLDWDEPVDPTLKAAQSSQALHVLSQKEIQAFGEFNDTVDALESHHFQMNDAWSRVSELQQEYELTGRAAIQVTPEHLERYLDALVHARRESRVFDHWALGVRGAAAAIERGERDLDEIQRDERDPW
jgi:hypothetical protein